MSNDAPRRAALKPVHYFALLVFAEGLCYPYSLAKEIARRSHGAVRPGPASIHRTLEQLVADGYVRETTERPRRALDDPRRRYYEITASGVAAARSETARLEAIVSAARAELSRLV